MSIKEVYIWYCREKGVLGEAIKKFYDSKLTIRDSNGYLRHVSLDEHINPQFYYFGINYVVEYLFDYKNSTNDSEKYALAKKQWRYFVKHNVKLKEDYKEGDKVEYSYGSQINPSVAKLISLDKLDGYVYVESQNGYKHCIPYSCVKRINGKPFKMDFYIKRKGKTYGID